MLTKQGKLLQIPLAELLNEQKAVESAKVAGGPADEVAGAGGVCRRDEG